MIDFPAWSFFIQCCCLVSLAFINRKCDKESHPLSRKESIAMFVPFIDCNEVCLKHSRPLLLLKISCNVRTIFHDESERNMQQTSLNIAPVFLPSFRE